MYSAESAPRILPSERINGCEYPVASQAAGDSCTFVPVHTRNPTCGAPASPPSSTCRLAPRYADTPTESGLNQVLLEEDLAHLLGWYAALQLIEDILAAKVRDYVGGLLKPLQLLSRRLIEL